MTAGDDNNQAGTGRETNGGRLSSDRHAPGVAWSVAAILLWAAALRFHGIGRQGFRLCDEGYYLLHPMNLVYSPTAEAFLYYKHGLCLMVSWFVRGFGPAPSSVLACAAACGMITVVVTFVAVRHMFDTKTALAATAVLASLKYVLFYHRSNLSDGYALMIFAIVLTMLAALITTVERYDRSSSGWKRRAGPLAVGAGLLIGFSFTVRIQTCLSLLGMVGVMVLLLPWLRPKADRGRVVWRYIGVGSCVAAASVIGYAAVMLYLGDRVDWPRTLEWYEKNLAIARVESQVWRPYLIGHLRDHTIGLFPLVAMAGVGLEMVRCRRRSSPLRLWFLVCTLGLAAAHVAAAMPWPRGQLNLVYLLAIYWGVGLSGLLSWNVARPAVRRAGVAAILITTVVSESLQGYLMFALPHGYDTVNAYLVQRDPGSRGKRPFVATHSWPVIGCSYGSSPFIVYDLVDEPDYGAFCRGLQDIHERYGARFVILDLNVTYFAGRPMNQMLQEFVLSNLPDLVVANDMANEAQCVADAVAGQPPREDMFSRRIVVYDLDRLAPILDPDGRVMRFTSDADMDRRLGARIRPSTGF